MKKKTTKTKQVFGITDASRFILIQLWSEFREQKLSINDLHNTYQGLSPKELKERCVAEGIDEVDFDLAMNDLENHNLVDTGPKDVYDNPPNSLVVIIGIYSKREYSYLTVDGYKEAVKLASTAPPIPRPSAHIHITRSTFNNSPIGVGNQVEQSITISDASVEQVLQSVRQEVEQLGDTEVKRQAILERLDELVAARDTLSLMDRYTKLVATIGDHITVFGPFLPVLLDKLMQLKVATGH